MKQEVKTDKFTFESGYDGLTLHATAYLPKKPKGILQVVHGMCEHMGRYEEMLQYFAENGYVACGFDQRGHGASAPFETDLGWFGDTEGKAVVDDAVRFTRLMKERYPGIPVYLYGHSMGSMIARCYLQEHDGEIDKLIVSGSPNKNVLAGVAVLLAKGVKLVKSSRHRSKMLRNLSTGSGDDKFPGEGKNAWLTRDKSVVEAYNADPKCAFIFTVNGFENLFNLLKNAYDDDLFQVSNPDLPIHFVAGSDDPIIGNEDKWLFGHRHLRERGYRNVSGKLYHGMRHEPHNEIGKEDVFADVLGFLEK